MYVWKIDHLRSALGIKMQKINVVFDTLVYIRVYGLLAVLLRLFIAFFHIKAQVVFSD